MNQSEKQLQSQRIQSRMSDEYHAGVDLIRQAIDKMKAASEATESLDKMYPGNHTWYTQLRALNSLTGDLESICKNGEVQR